MADIATGLLSHWKLDETSGTNAGDSGPANNPLTLTGSANWGTEEGVHFDGADDQGKTASNTIGDYDNSACTITARVNIDGTGYALTVATVSEDFGLYVDSGVLICHVYVGNSSWRSYKIGTLTLDTWHDVACTWDNATDTVSIFLDGALAGTSLQSGVSVSYTTNTSTVFHIGSLNNNYDFKGRISNVRIYDRALPLADIIAVAAEDAPGTIPDPEPEPDGDITTDLEGYWKLDETGSSTTVADTSGNSRDLVAQGYGDLTASRVGDGTDFDGANDQMHGEGMLTTFNYPDITIAGWIKRDRLDSTWQWVAAVADNVGLYVDDLNDSLRFYFYNGSSWEATTETPTDINDTAWHHVVGMWNSTTDTITLYLDGVLLRSETFSGLSISYTDVAGDDFQIGAMQNTREFAGRIADVRVYSRALTTTDVERLYNTEPFAATPIDTTNLVAEWLFDEAASGSSPTTVYDNVSDNDLTIDYASNASWMTDAGRGIQYTNTTHGGRIGVDNVSSSLTNLAQALGDACQKLTFLAVVKSINGASDWQRLVQWGSDAGNGNFTITFDENDTLVDLRFGDDTPVAGDGIAIQYLNTEFDAGPHVLAVVMDTTEPTLANRMRLYKDGVLQTATNFSRVGSGGNTQGYAVDFNNSAHNFAFMNRPDGGRSIQGAIQYGAFFDTAMSSTQIGLMTTALLADNDASLIQTGAVDRTLTGQLYLSVDNAAVMLYGAPIDASNLIAEWLYDEATSGTTPTVVYDNVGAADLDISYAGAATWVDSDGGGLAFTDLAHVGEVGVEDIPSGIRSALGSACQKMSCVIVGEDLVGHEHGGRIVYLGADTGNGEFAILMDDGGEVHSVRFGEDSTFLEGLYFEYRNTFMSGGPHVLVAVIDTTEPSLYDRCKLYKNGVLQVPSSTAATGATFVQNSTADFNLAGIKLKMLNRPDGLRPTIGGLHYSSLFSTNISAAQVSSISAQLLADNDLSLLVSKAYGLTGVSAVSVSNAATLAYEDIGIPYAIVGSQLLSTSSLAEFRYTDEGVHHGIVGTGAVTVGNAASTLYTNVTSDYPPYAGATAISVGSGATFEYENLGIDYGPYAGTSAVAVAPSAFMGYAASGSIAGYVAIAVTSSATTSYTRTIFFAGATTLAVSATSPTLYTNVAIDHSLSGSLAFAIENWAHFAGTNVPIGYEYAGATQLIVYNAAALQFTDAPIHYTYEGNTPIAATPAAEFVYSRHYFFSGSSSLTAVGSATLAYYDRVFDFDIDGYAEVSVTPSSTLSYNRNAEIIGLSFVPFSAVALQSYQRNPIHYLAGSTTIEFSAFASVAHSASRVFDDPSAAVSVGNSAELIHYDRAFGFGITGYAGVKVDSGATFFHSATQSFLADAQIDVTCSATFERSYSYRFDGTTSVDIGSSAALVYNTGYVFAGASAVTVSNSAILAYYDRIFDYDIAGHTPLAVVSSSSTAFNDNTVTSGALSISVASTAVTEWTHIPFEYALAGQSAVALAAGSSTEFNRGYALAGSLALSVSAESATGYAAAHDITGDARVTVAVAADMVYARHYALLGGASVTLAATAGLSYASHYWFEADTPWVVDPTAAIDRAHNHGIAGTSEVTVAASAATEYDLYHFYVINVNGNNTIERVHTEVVINVEFAGGEEGYVTIGGVEQSALEWSDTQVKVPAFNYGLLPTGKHDVIVYKPKRAS